MTNPLTLDIFPDLPQARAGYIDMNACAATTRRQPARSQFLDADLTHRFLSRIHHRAGIDYTFGGYLEDRRTLWRGTYLKPETATHLAIDVNVRADTALSVIYPSRVAAITHDPDQNGGWGSVVFFALDKPIGDISHFLYAHLSKGGIRLKEGDAARPGEVTSLIGRPHENGGWYEHLHVQAFTQEAWEKFGGDLKKFDGYGAAPAGKVHPLFPDPSPLLKI